MNTIQEPLKEEHTHTNTTKKSVSSVSSKTSVIQTKKYPAYKDSGVEWIGDIPEHWHSKPFFTIGKVVSENNNQNGELLSVYLEKGVIKFSDVSEKRTNVTSEDLSKYQTVELGYLVLNNQQAWRGSVGVSKYKGIVSPAYIVLKLSNKINSDFANYLFRDGAMVSNYLICSKGVGTIQRNLYWPQLKRANVCFPPLSEQTSIAAFLDRKTAKIEQAIHIKQKQIELLQERRQILIHKSVTKGINPNVKLKDSGVEWIGEIPEGWEVKKLKYIVNIQGGYAFNSAMFKNEGIQIIKIANTYMNELCLDRQPTYVDKTFLKSHKEWIVGKGDILMSLTGTLGKKDYGFAILIENDEQFLLNQRVAKITMKHGFEADYVLNILRSEMYLNQLYQLPSGTKQANLSNDDVLNIKIVFPADKKERQFILDFIVAITTKIATTISLKEQEIEKLKEYKASLINSVVTGKVKVF
ncbi:MAG TPA: restriction endonuclease subunit S [Chitinophagales bacterium]|nr:restriction endonuclease subunit S [Chitinophagales bacterium]